MSALQVVGLVILAAPLALFFAVTVMQEGLRRALVIWGVSIIATTLIAIGSLLVTGWRP